jgi:hypothetical protein
MHLTSKDIYFGPNLTALASAVIAAKSKFVGWHLCSAAFVSSWHEAAYAPCRLKCR